MTATATSTSRSSTTSTGWSLVFSFSIVLTVLVYLHLDVAFIIRIVVLSLFALGLVTLFLYLFEEQLKGIVKCVFHRQTNAERQNLKLAIEDYSNQQRDATERKQNEFREKAAKYEEEILRPREEAKRSKHEEKFYRFAGVVWKGKSQRLGESEMSDEAGSEKPLPQKRVKGTSRDAVEVRKLPDRVATRPVVVEQQQIKKKKIVLPDEPSVTDYKCITVAMRNPQSQIKKRRFLYTDKIQVIMDWMAKQGYHPSLYTVCTVYPRRDLSKCADADTLADMNIVHDVMVVIEERDN